MKRHIEMMVVLLVVVSVLAGTVGISHSNAQAQCNADMGR
jgi:hypothetical protein